MEINEIMLKSNVINFFINQLGIRTITEINPRETIFPYLNIPVSYSGYDEIVLPHVLNSIKCHNMLKITIENNYHDVDFNSDLLIIMDSEGIKDNAIKQHLIHLNSFKFIITYGQSEFKNKNYEIINTVNGHRTSDDKVFEFPNGNKFFVMKQLNLVI